MQVTGDQTQQRRNHPPLPGLRVLVVDDSVDAAESLSLLLKELGQTVRTTNDGRTALLVAAQFRPQLIMVDIVMPRMDGFELAGALRDMTGLHATRIVAVTGHGGENLRAMTASQDFDAHLVKPVTEKDLVTLLASP
jgi:CheY-like chemotaxis protein